MRRFACLLAAGLVLGACTTPGTLDEDAAPLDVEENVLRTILPNGLKIVLVEDHAAPVVALNVWVRTGGADERPDEAGMAHVFEHMLFKGTERRAVGEIAATVEAAGGNINAFTSYDMTVYHITMASRDLARGVDVLADAVLHSAFDPDELQKETEVVVEEIRRGLDSPGRALSEAIFGLAYREHPYRLPVIGNEESVRSFSREQLLAFHDRWYVPNNMTFIVVGDIEPEAVLAQIQDSFRDAQPREDLSHGRPPEPEQTAPRTTVVRMGFEQTLLGVAFPIASFEHPDTPYLDLLSEVLGRGESSRLYRSVKDRRRLVHSISAGAYTPKDNGLFFIDAVLDPEHLEAALEAIRDELERLRRYGPSESELERARTNLLSQEVREKETVQGQARKYGYWETLSNGVEREKEYLERIRGATVQDVRRVAEQYLRADRSNAAVVLPEQARPEIDEGVLLAALSSPERERAAFSEEQLGDGIRSYRLPNGLRVVVKPNRAVALVAMRLSFLGGLLIESEQTQGLSSFLAELLEKGTEQRSSAQLAAEVEGIAGSLSGFSGRNTIGLTAEFLSDSFDKGLELFADVLLHPAFEQSEIDKLRAETLAALKRREDSLAQKAMELFAQGLYPGHPYRFPTLGVEKSVQDFDRELLLETWQRYARPANGVLAIVGDVDPDRVVEALARRLSDWDGAEPVPLPERPKPSAPSEPRELSIEKGKQQVHIVMGFPGLALADPDAPALEVLTQVLSGQGGRLFAELRDKRSLAYSVTAFSIEGVDPGSFAVYIASAPEKLEDSMEGLRGELKRLLDSPPSKAEIERAKAYLIGTHAISLQRYSSQAALLSLDELYGLGATHHMRYAERIEAVSTNDLEQIARRIIRLDAPLVAIVK